jgi:uncharacterized membrane protein
VPVPPGEASPKKKQLRELVEKDEAYLNEDDDNLSILIEICLVLL